MQGLFYSLILAAISALAFVAYRHHKAFVKIASILYGASLITCLAMNLWNIAITVAGSAAQRAIEYQGAEKIRQATEALQIPYGVLIISFILWMGYLMILRFLPNILNLNEKVNQAERGINDK
jgi:hypothetical protein